MAQKAKLSNPESCWIQYRLALRGIEQEDVAKKAGRSFSLVSRVINGTRRSRAVESALADMLGYPSYSDLVQAARIETKRASA